MSCAMTREEAARLHSVLDEKIGVFRVENMPARALEIYEEKREDFINVFSFSIPEDYWFQGIQCTSANLAFDSIEGLHVVCVNGDKQIQDYIDAEVNPLLKDFEYEAYQDPELSNL